MAQNWDEHVNQRAYGQDGGYSDNVEQVEFKSGRIIRYMKNSKAKKEHALKFTFDDSVKINGFTEFEYFLLWVDLTLKNNTLSFYFPDVISHTVAREYYLKTYPSWRGQKYKEISVTFVEA